MVIRGEQAGDTCGEGRRAGRFTRAPDVREWVGAHEVDVGRQAAAVRRVLEEAEAAEACGDARGACGGRHGKGMRAPRRGEKRRWTCSNLRRLGNGAALNDWSLVAIVFLAFPRYRTPPPTLFHVHLVARSLLQRRQTSSQCV
eukprot:4720181-Pleurochrysis_carterae.AAC.1